MSRASFLIDANHRLDFDVQQTVLGGSTFVAHLKGASHQVGAACGCWARLSSADFTGFSETSVRGQTVLPGRSAQDCWPVRWLETRMDKRSTECRAGEQLCSKSSGFGLKMVFVPRFIGFHKGI
jgi:hypothetical protein